ncbi:HotDog domain-containing protein [Hypoxylon sp. FL1150]|nr:HotDog domain-containing protein [Hypoxylon sp. FL1150]
MVDTQTPSPDYEHFSSISWCSAHLKRPRVIAGTPACRSPKANGEDTLMAETLTQTKTIVAFLEFYEEPPSPTDRVDLIKAFLTLGSGLNGHPDVCHGGIVSTILDEVTGLLIPINQQRGFMPDIPYFTAYLNVTFLRPVPTCATILAQAKIVKVQGRKYFAEGWIEDSDGTILARAEVLYLAVKSAL